LKMVKLVANRNPTTWVAGNSNASPSHARSSIVPSIVAGWTSSLVTLRKTMQIGLKQLQRNRYHVYLTHDQEEALSMSIEWSSCKMLHRTNWHTAASVWRPKQPHRHHCDKYFWRRHH
jgi:hypothetical protein